MLCFSNDLWFVAPEGRKVGSLKRRVRSQLARWEMKNCTPLWREARFQVKMYKAHHVRTTFGSWDVEKVHDVVARSTFPSENCTKHTSFGPLLEVEMLKKRTPLWREAHFEVKMYKTHHSRTTFGSSDVEKVHAVVARSTFPSQNVKHTMYGPFLEVQMSFRVAGARDCAPCQKWPKREGFVAFSTTTTTTPHYIPIHYTTTTTTTTPSLHSTTLRSTTVHCTQLHSITLLHYTTLHYTTLHYTPLHYTTLHYTTLHYTTLHYITLHYTTFHYTTLHYITLHYTTLHNATTTTTQNYTTLHYITLQYTTFHYTPLHYTTLHWMTLHHR